MSTILPGLDSTNRLVEAVGSAALVQDVAAPPLAPLGGGLDLLGALAGADAAGATATQSSIDPLPLAGIPGDGLLNILDVANLGDSIGDTNGSVLTLAGPGATAQPVIDPVNQVVLDLHQQLEVLFDQFGIPEVGHGITNLGETIGLGYTGSPSGPGGTTNLVAGVVNLPGNALNGNLNGSLQNIGNDLTHTVNAANTALTYVLHGNDATNPIPELLPALGHTLQTLPLLTLNGGNHSGDGGILGGVVGDIAHSNTGHLIDLDIGPSQSGGVPINLLSTGDGNTHTVSVNAVDVGPTGPHPLDAGLLTDSGIIAPLSLGGATTDGLLGSLAGGSASGLPDVGQVIPAALPLPPITDVAGIGHGILDLHGAHII